MRRNADEDEKKTKEEEEKEEELCVELCVGRLTANALRWAEMDHANIGV